MDAEPGCPPESHDPGGSPAEVKKKVHRDRNLHLLFVGWRALLHASRPPVKRVVLVEMPRDLP